jgi:hypothetical protein
MNSHETRKNTAIRRAKIEELSAAGKTPKEIAQELSAPVDYIRKDLRKLTQRKRAEARLEQARKKAEAQPAPPPQESIEPLVLQEMKPDRLDEGLAKFKGADDHERERDERLMREARDYMRPKLAQVKERLATFESFIKQTALPFCRKIEGNQAIREPEIARLVGAIRATFNVPGNLRLRIGEVEKISLYELTRYAVPWKIVLDSRISGLNFGAIERDCRRYMKQIEHILAGIKQADIIRSLQAGKTLIPEPRRERPTRVILANDDLA